MNPSKSKCIRAAAIFGVANVGGLHAFVVPQSHNSRILLFPNPLHFFLQPDGFMEGDRFDGNPVYRPRSPFKTTPQPQPTQNFIRPPEMGAIARDKHLDDPYNVQDVPDHPGNPMTRLDPNSGPKPYFQNHPHDPSSQRRSSVVQGSGSRATFGHHGQDPYGIQEMKIHLGTAGRPLEAIVEQWSGPNNTPATMKLFSEDGGRFPWKTKFKTPTTLDQTGVTEIRNIGPLEFPLEASVTSHYESSTPAQLSVTNNLRGQENQEPAASSTLGQNLSPPKQIQGGDLTTFGFDAAVEEVYVEISSEGRDMNAKVELYQGPYSDSAIAEIYSDNGKIRPWSAVIPIPGRDAGASICILNTGPMEYPIIVRLDPPANYVSFF